MTRPKKRRCVCCEPTVNFFKPRGIPLASLEVVNLTLDEFEAIRLKDLEGLEQGEAAEKMNVSQPTLHRILESARTKIADAVVNGKAIRIEGGNYVITKETRRFECYDCESVREEPYGTGRPVKCSECGSTNIHRALEDRDHARAGRD